MADRGHLKKKIAPKKIEGAISYDPLLGSHSSFMWLISGYAWWSNHLVEFINNKMEDGDGGHLEMKLVDAISYDRV